MKDNEVIETLNDMKGVFGKRGHSQYSLYSIDRAIAALEKQVALEDSYTTLEEVVARNTIAWETSKDKREGLLPEIYLTNLFLFEKLTGLEPTMPNLKKVGKLD